MSFLQALFLGLIQGVTEFLPISSSGHLTMLENLFQISKKTGLLFVVLLHVGTLAVLVIAFRKDLLRLLLEGCKSIYDIFENLTVYFYNKNHHDAKRYKKVISNNYRRLNLLLVFTTIPTAILGILLEDFAKQTSGNFLAPAIGFFLTAVLLIVIDLFPAGNKIPKDVGYGTALIIGIFQGFSVLPGISRLGVVISLCLLFGYNRKFAVKYSFLTAIPVVFGALILELYHMPEQGITADYELAIFAGAIVSGIVGYICLKFIVNGLRRKQFFPFAIYCIILGIVSVVCYFVI